MKDKILRQIFGFIWLMSIIGGAILNWYVGMKMGRVIGFVMWAVWFGLLAFPMKLMDNINKEGWKFEDAY